MNDNFKRAIMASALAVGFALIPALGDSPIRAEVGTVAAGSGHKPIKVRLLMPRMDAKKGMYIFASKGCVACHAINGVGGHEAARLDAHAMKPVMNPFEFVARMWRMSPAMVPAQEEELGGQITFTGAEISAIIAFVHDDAQQHQFKQSMIPAKIKKKMKHLHKTPGHKKELGHQKGRV